MKNDKINSLTITYEPILTQDNIEYVFQKLSFAIIASTNYALYKDSFDDFRQILKILNKWIGIYINTKSIKTINWQEFIEVRQKLFELDSKYLSMDGFYAADAYEWIIQLQILLEKCCKEGE